MKTKVKEKICRNKDCRRRFTPYSSLQVACSKSCAIKIQKVHCELKVPKEVIEVISGGIGPMKQELQKMVNEIVRLIDKGLPCISCSNDHTPQAGHFHSVGAKPFLRFNLNNIHVQGHKCNIELTGNREGYFKGICDRYGHGYASMVEHVLPGKFRHVKLSRHELKEAITSAKDCLQELKNRIVPIETNQERLKLRLIYNNRIGIYKL